MGILMVQDMFTIIKTDTRIQRCVVSDPFSHYKPEDEKHIKKFKVEEDETLQQLKDTFKRVRYGSVDTSSYKEEYDRALSLVYKLKYNSSDITKVLFALPEVRGRKYFNFNAGLFLSALINNCKDEKFVLITEHLSMAIDCIGYMNTKQITIQGNVGNYLGRSMENGLITTYGNAGDSIGFEMNGGSIIIHGNAEDEAGSCMKEGTITIKGNAGRSVGHYLHSGTIFLEGDHTSLSNNIGFGNIFHNGKQIVKDGKRLI